MLLVLLIVGVGCRSYPKRDLSTPEGAMAAYFYRKSEDVKKLNTAGFSNEEIAGEAGIEAEEFQTIRGQALEELLKY
ncbi:MAG: hypothetical protein GX817_07680 [Elusimicrobia bacterium]|nr:hypothetical protein [Elusimicrobiota bacterium]